MRYAIIENKKVVNVIVADQDFIDENCPDAIECDDGVNIGHIYEKNKFVAPEPIILLLDETISE